MMITRLGLTRTVVKPSYALLAPDGHVASALPGWSKCTSIVLISASRGAAFSQYLITLHADGGRGEGETGEDSWFFFVVSGTAAINGATLSRGGFAYVPPGDRYAVHGARGGAVDDAGISDGPTVLLIFRKPYELLAAHAAPAFFTGHEDAIAETPFLGDPHARLKVLIPDTPAADMAVNVFTYDPGATLPFVETHVMEHGMLFLAGGGVYRLDEDWHPVTAGDAIWIAPYCPQWFIAAGPGPARYIYYKDVNRLPA
jgi:(S)-ureidoglycine aminohydrolase